MTFKPPVFGILFCLCQLISLGLSAPAHAERIELEPKHNYYILDGRLNSPVFGSAGDAFAQVQTDLQALVNAPGSGWCSLIASGLRDAEPELLLSPPRVYRWDLTYQQVTQEGGCTAPQTSFNVGIISRLSPCNSGYTAATKVGHDGRNHASCYRDFPEPPITCTTGCGVGNPIVKEVGVKAQTEVDFSGPSGIHFGRSYSSQKNGFSGNFDVFVRSSPLMTRSGGCIPGTWTDPAGVKHPYCFPIISGDNKVKLGKPGISREIAFDGTTLAKMTGDIRDTITRLLDGGVHTGWQVHNARNGNLERFNASGQLQEITLPSGQKQQLTYTGGQLTSVTDHFGRAIGFTYNGSGRLQTMTDPSGGVYSYTYDAKGNLDTVTYPDLNLRRYHYEDTTSIHALTGITDENGTRFATYGYDAIGRGTTTEHAGSVNKYTIDYIGAPNVIKVTDPLLTQRTYTQQLVQGTYTTYSTSQPCSGAGCGSNATEDLTFDANGNVTSRKDFNGFRTCFAFDLTRNLESFRAEGMGASSCPGTLSSWTPTAATTQRKTTITWHPTWRLQKQIAEPKRLTTLKYHGESGVSCAPSGASTQLVCEKRVDATTDLNGGSGLSATLDTAVPARIWSWTYNVHGQVLTATDPRNNVTTYTYHPATTALVTQGDLASITTPSPTAGQPAHVTQFTEYDGAGRLKKMLDPNGLETTLTYHPRGWLATRTVGSNTGTPETTTYTYDNVGQLTQVTQPDTSTIQYHYDAAHRLWKINDGLGNNNTYTLDNMGNRTAEEYRDPGNQLSRKLTREYDALNRLKYDKSGYTPAAPNTAQSVTEYGYDNQGNLKKITDPLARITDNDYDGLNRLIKVTDSQSPTRGITEYTYDGQDNLTTVKDPKLLTTTYTYNGLGDLKTQVSPDTGTTTFTHDVAGNVLTKADARSVTATYTYDALNRVATIAYPAVSTDPAETVTYTYDTCTNGKGRLCTIVDKTGTTTYAYDLKGRVTTKSQIHGGLTQSVGYSYNAAGQLATVTYPSGRVITYTYTNGRPVSVAVNGKTVLSNAVYEPFGPLGGWHWGNSTPQAVNAHLRVFDLDYRAISVQSDQVGLGPRTRDLTWNLASAITAITEPGNPTNSYTYGYDAVDRLTAVTPSGQSQKYGYSYDLNGNRLSATDTGATTNYSYPSPFTSHKLTGLTGAQVKTFGYDAIGNMTTDGSNTWRYGGNNRPYEVVTPGGTVSVVINALGQRIKKAAGANATRFVYDEAGRLIGEYNNAGTRLKEHVWLNDLPVAVVP